MDGRRRHLNGVKTAALFGVMWAVLLGIGALVASGTGSGAFIWIFALIGLATTAYGYWNSDKIALRAMKARPVSEAEAPAMYRIVRELSTRARQPMPRRTRKIRKWRLLSWHRARELRSSMRT